MRKLPLIFLPLLLIALSAFSRSPSLPTAEPPVPADRANDDTAGTNQRAGTRIVFSAGDRTHAGTNSTVGYRTGFHHCGSGHAPKYGACIPAPVAYGAACHKVTGSTHTAGANNRTARPAGDGAADRGPIRHRLLDRLCADRRHGKGAGSGTIGRGLLGQPHLRKSKLHLPGARHHRPTEPLCR